MRKFGVSFLSMALAGAVLAAPVSAQGAPNGGCSTARDGTLGNTIANTTAFAILGALGANESAKAWFWRVENAPAGSKTVIYYGKDRAAFVGTGAVSGALTLGAEAGGRTGSTEIQNGNKKGGFTRGREQSGTGGANQAQSGTTAVSGPAGIYIFEVIGPNGQNILTFNCAVLEEGGS